MAKTAEVTLPNSGEVVTIKKPGPLGLSAILGSLPSASALLGALEKKLKGEEAEFSADDLKVSTADTVKQMMTLVCACCVKPKYSIGGVTPGTLDIDDVEWGDFVYLFNAVYSHAGFAKALEAVRPTSPTATSS